MVNVIGVENWAIPETVSSETCDSLNSTFSLAGLVNPFFLKKAAARILAPGLVVLGGDGISNIISRIKEALGG